MRMRWRAITEGGARNKQVVGDDIEKLVVKLVEKERREAQEKRDALVLPDPPLANGVEVDPLEEEFKLRLARVPGGCVLLRRGTGEMAFLPCASGFRWVLSIGRQWGKNVDILGLQEISNGAMSNVKRADEVLTLRLWRVPVPPAQDARLPENHRGLLIEKKATRNACWRSDQRRAKVARGVFQSIPSDQCFLNPPLMVLKVWFLQIGWARDCHCLVELPHVQNLLFGNTNAAWVRDCISQ